MFDIYIVLSLLTNSSYYITEDFVFALNSLFYKHILAIHTAIAYTQLMSIT